MVHKHVHIKDIPESQWHIQKNLSHDSENVQEKKGRGINRKVGEG